MRLSLEIICPSMGGHEEAVTNWQDTLSKPWPIRVLDEREGDEAGFLHKCERGWRESDATVIGFLHSDLFVHEFDFDRRVLAEFTKPNVAVVGFLGATSLGHPDLYKTPYSLGQLARYGVVSNFTDAEVHGRRDAGTCEVAVIDSCAVFVRREFLARCGGWPIQRYPNNAHCSDLWLCCMAHRLHQDVEMVGVSCTHRSGGKGEAGSRWLEAHGGDLAHHRQAHELIAADFGDVLPWSVR